MRWLEDVLRTEAEVGEIVHNNLSYAQQHSRIYTPIKGGISRMGYVAYNSHDLAQAEREKVLLRKAILDEDLPYQMPLRFDRSWVFWNGGRFWDAFLLGRIKDTDSIPELMEAASHDLNADMRSYSIEAIGKMGKGAYDEASKVSLVMFNDVDMYVRQNAAEVLGKIGNPIVVPDIRDVIEDILPYIRNLEIQGYPHRGSDKKKKKEMEQALLLLENAMRSLYKFDPVSGREMASKALNDWSDHIRHYAKRAVFWFKDIDSA